MDAPIEIPNKDKPEYPIKTIEKRVSFKALYLKIVPLAKEDGCIFIPYEETTDEKRKEK